MAQFWGAAAPDPHTSCLAPTAAAPAGTAPGPVASRPFAGGAPAAIGSPCVPLGKTMQPDAPPSEALHPGQVRLATRLSSGIAAFLEHVAAADGMW